MIIHVKYGDLTATELADAIEWVHERDVKYSITDDIPPIFENVPEGGI